MSKIYTKDGKIKFPVDIAVNLPENKYGMHKEKVVLYNAYCQNGHDMMSDVLIDGNKGINLIYRSKDTREETEIVISPVIGDNSKQYIKGNPFIQGEEVKVYCPECKIELPILLNCYCQAPIYIFYMDKQFQKSYAQSFCSRIGCSQSSKIRFSQDILQEFLVEHSF